MHDPLGAFCRHVDITLSGDPKGTLAGLRFAIKDIFDTAGNVSCCGNPDWLATHPPAARNAPAVDALLAAGATAVGKTLTDELAYSLSGENFHYGTPVNTAAPGRICGGSSCGSAAAVAGGLVDFALGSDTGGSVRVPASLCGIFGIRTTHGRIPLDGIMPLAPSFDTVGWFARDPAILSHAGAVLLGEDRERVAAAGLLVASDAFALAEDAVQAVLTHWTEAAAALVGRRQDVTIAKGNEKLGDWMLAFRQLQAREVWAAHGRWITRTRPRFGPEIAARFDWARSVAESPPGDEAARRESFTARLDALLEGGAVLCLPAAPSIALRVGEGAETLQRFRDRTLSLTCIAGLARLPQVTIPAGRVEGCPVGFSLVMRRGADRALLELATALATRLPRQES